MKPGRPSCSSGKVSHECLFCASTSLSLDRKYSAITCPTAEASLSVLPHLEYCISFYHQLKVLFFQQNYFTFVLLLDLTIKQRLLFEIVLVFKQVCSRPSLSLEPNIKKWKGPPQGDWSFVTLLNHKIQSNDLKSEKCHASTVGFVSASEAKP